MGRHRTAGDRGRHLDDRGAEPDPRSGPGVLLVGSAADEFDEHPEATRIDGADAEHHPERIE